MFNPNNLDEVCVQATHIESKGKSYVNNYSKNPFKLKEINIKYKVKYKKIATIKKEGENPTCSHCNKGHDFSKWLKLHLELRPKKYGGYKDKGKAKNVGVVL